MVKILKFQVDERRRSSDDAQVFSYLCRRFVGDLVDWRSGLEEEHDEYYLMTDDTEEQREKREN